MRARWWLLAATLALAVSTWGWWEQRSDEVSGPERPAPPATTPDEVTGPQLTAAAVPPRHRSRSPEPEPASKGIAAEATDVLVPAATLDVRVVGWMRRPLAGVQVRLVLPRSGPEEDYVDAQPPQRTDRDGRTRFVGIERADVGVTASSDGYSTDWEWPKISSGSTGTVEVGLTPRLKLAVRVLDASDGRPLVGAKVHAREGSVRQLYVPIIERGRTEILTVATDGDGAAVLEGLFRAAPHALWVEAPGYEHGERAWSHQDPDVASSLELRVARAGRAIVTIRDQEGEPVKGYRVALVPPEVLEQKTRADRPWNPHPKEGTLEAELPGYRYHTALLDSAPPFIVPTSSSGVAVVEGLRLGGRFRLLRHHWEGMWFGASRALPDPGEVTVTVGQPEVRLDLRLERCAIIELQCTDPSGAAVRHVRATVGGVTLESGDESPGVVELRDPARTFVVDLAAEGFLPKRVEVTAGPGERRTEEVRLDPGAVVRGRLVDEAGDPFPGAWVRMERGAVGATTETDPSGEFRVAGLPPGPCALTFGSADAGRTGRREVTAPAEDVHLTLPRLVLAHVTACLRSPDIVASRPDGEVRCLVVPFGSSEDWGWPDHAPKFVDLGANTRRWDLPPGHHELRVETSGCRVFTRSFELHAGQSLDLGVIHPVLIAPVEGQLLFADRTPAAGARAHFRGLGGVYADDAGRFQLAYGPSGPVTAVVGAQGRPAALIRVPAPEPGVLWEIVIPHGGGLSGHIPGSGTSADLGLRVEPMDAEGREPLEQPEVDSSGRFFVPLLAGRYRVTLGRRQETLVSREVRILEGESSSVVLPVDGAR